MICSVTGHSYLVCQRSNSASWLHLYIFCTSLQVPALLPSTWQHPVLLLLAVNMRCNPLACPFPQKGVAGHRMHHASIMHGTNETTRRI